MDESSEGCSQVVAYNPYQWELATTLDPAKDLERIHQMIWTNIKTLELIYNEGGEKLHWQTESSHRSFLYPILMNDKAKCRKTIYNMISIADNLDDIHTKCNQTLLQKLLPGSKEIPIGDDNYLQMTHMNRGFATKRTVVSMWTWKKLIWIVHRIARTHRHSICNYMHSQNILRQSLNNFSNSFNFQEKTRSFLSKNLYKFQVFLFFLFFFLIIFRFFFSNNSELFLLT